METRSFALIPIQPKLDFMADLEALLNDITFMGIDHGIDSISDDAAPLIPFAITESAPGKRQLQRFLTDQLEQGLEDAKAHVDSLKGNIIRYAIAWDGFVALEGKKWDAIFVESGDTESESGHLMCQRYERKGLLKKKNVPYGNPALIEKIESRIR